MGVSPIAFLEQDLFQKCNGAGSDIVMAIIHITMGIKPGKYRHFKGDTYEVFNTALHSETLEEFVVYRPITGKHANETHLWVRPIKMFLETVERDGKKMPRFEYIG